MQYILTLIKTCAWMGLHTSDIDLISMSQESLLSIAFRKRKHLCFLLKKIILLIIPVIPHKHFIYIFKHSFHWPWMFWRTVLWLLHTRQYDHSCMYIVYCAFSHVNHVVKLGTSLLLNILKPLYCTCNWRFIPRRFSWLCMLKTDYTLYAD